MGDGLTITERQRQRFETVREECDNDHLPEPTDEQVMEALLDTWFAVGDGFYFDE